MPLAVIFLLLHEEGKHSSPTLSLAGLVTCFGQKNVVEGMGLALKRTTAALSPETALVPCGQAQAGPLDGERL